MSATAFTRQLDIFDPIENSLPITLIGCGSIGSYTGVTLSKLGFKDFILYDGDRIETHNLSNQYYTKEDIGRAKVNALKDIIEKFSPYRKVNVLVKNEYYNNQNLLNDIVIVCTDNIESRRLVYSKWKESLFSKFLIDARMGGELMHIYTISKHSPEKHIKDYENSLKIENQPLPCTARTIVYNISVIGGLIGNIVKKICNNEEYPYHIMFHLKTLELLVNWDL